MLTLIIFALSWLIFLLWGDKKRIPEIFPTSMFSSFLALLTDLIVEKYQLWSYKDDPLTSYCVALFLDFGLYPIVAYFFIQFLPKTFKQQITYIFFWTIGTILMEYFYYCVEIITYERWWKLYFSYISDWIIFSLFIIQYKYYSKRKVNL